MMKKVQGSTAAKVCVWIVLIAAAFGTGVFGVRTVLSLPSVYGNNWQDSARFHNALASRREELVEGVDMAYRLMLLEKRIEAGEADAALQADAEALRESRASVEERFARENTWFRFRLMNADTGEVLGTNLEENESMLKRVGDVYHTTFTLTDDGNYWTSYGSYMEGGSYEVPPEDKSDQGPAQTVKLTLEYGVSIALDENGVKDEFELIHTAWMNDQYAFKPCLTGTLSLGALMLLALIWILWTAGHRKGAEGIVTTWQEWIFFDVYAAAMIGVGTLCLFGAIWAAEQTYYQSSHQFYWAARGGYSPETYSALGIMGTAALCTGVAAAGSLLLRTFAVRVKAGCLMRTTLLYRVAAWTVRTVHDFIRFLPLTWKMVVFFGGYVIVSQCFFNIGRYDGFFMLIYFGIQIVMVVFLAWWALNYRRLRKGTKTIVKGDLEYQIDTRHMPYDLRLQAEDLNNISAGLSTAVDERMKSERFKAELITNVSHDLKTPLTSIINYVNLLKSTEQTDPKAVEYIEVLDRKSQRLKKLTEDLVEASKASTGVLSVTREKIGMSQLIDQALGEWEERLNARRLTLVTTLPEGETWVYADGRHLWRVIDNLLSNCAKYAMEGTRIYLDLERGKGQVALSVKNISRDALNVPAERLMERFVRGEESRSTEGSGLGLSIARSLTELQGGAFELAVDGDLFKAIVTLPQAS